MIKITSGQKNLDQINVADFVQQLRNADGISRMGELFGTHPYVTNRVTQLLSFSDSPEYKELQNLTAADITRDLPKTLDATTAVELTAASPIAAEAIIHGNADPEKGCLAKQVNLVEEKNSFVEDAVTSRGVSKSDAPHSFLIGTTGIQAPTGKIYIEGLASVFEGTVEYRLLDSSGRALETGFTGASDSLGWGYFIIELPDSGYDSIEIFDDCMTDWDGTYLKDRVIINR